MPKRNKFFFFLPRLTDTTPLLAMPAPNPQIQHALMADTHDTLLQDNVVELTGASRPIHRA